MRRAFGPLGVVVGAALASAAPGSCEPAAGQDPPPVEQPTTWTHDFPDVVVPAGAEQIDLCQSWTLGNDTPLYVDRVELGAGPGWHHSNWVYVDENDFPGPDGVWDCNERQFDEVTATLRGGVLTAQSTQSTHDVQAFPPGHVLVLPAHARIITTSHTLNVGDGDVTTHLSLTLHAIPRSQVVKKLRALSLENESIVLQPQATSRQTTRCDLGALHQEGTGRPVDFNVYFVLPHYHELGRGLTLRALGGDKDGQLIYESSALIGEPGGGTLTVPYDMTGTTGIELTCTFENPRAEAVRWGIGDQEMCVVLAFTDSDVIWGGGVLDRHLNQVLGQDAQGVWENLAPCSLYYFIPRD